MREPKKLIIDFDNTIVNSSEAVLKTLNGFIKEEELKLDINSKVTTWDFSDVVPQQYLRFVDTVFEMDTFFSNLKFYPNCHKTLLNLYSQGVEIICVTIGSSKNIENKIQWVKKYLPFVELIPIVKFKEVKMDKSIINGKNAVFIDDNQLNLYSMKTCKMKDRILFKYNDIKTDYNDTWINQKMTSWQDEKSLRLLYKRLGVKL